jgi:hypothetical protein
MDPSGKVNTPAPTNKRTWLGTYGFVLIFVWAVWAPDGLGPDRVILGGIGIGMALFLADKLLTFRPPRGSLTAMGPVVLVAMAAEVALTILGQASISVAIFDVGLGLAILVLFAWSDRQGRVKRQPPV